MPTSSPPQETAIVLVPRCGDTADPVIERTAARLLEYGIAMVDVEVVRGTAIQQLVDAIDALRQSDPRRLLRIGLMGGGTNAATALIAAAARAAVTTVVTYRTACEHDGDWLPALRAPAMFIVGSRDTASLRACGSVARRAVASTTLAVVSGASNMFEEPGAAEEAATLAAAWFRAQLANQNARVSPPAILSAS